MFTTCLCFLNMSVCEKCGKNISNQNCVKLKSCLSKMKELDQIVFLEGLFTSIKGQLCLTKDYLSNPVGQAEVEFPLIRSYF